MQLLPTLDFSIEEKGKISVLLSMTESLIMQLDAWHHEKCIDYDDPNPSELETFQLIAKVLVSKDTNDWKPKKVANNNWRNWPEAGTL